MNSFTKIVLRRLQTSYILTIAKFGITSTKNAFLINAILADALCNFDVILFNLI